MSKMGKFHFDENAVTNVHTELKETLVRMVAYSARFTEASNMLYNYVGFGISQAIECSEQERKKIKLCIEKIDMGGNSLNKILERVKFYNQLAIMRQKSGNFVESVSNQTLGNEFDKYTHYVSECVKENNNFLTELSIGLDFDTLFNETLSGFIKTGKLDGADRNNCKKALVSVLNSLTKDKDSLGITITNGMNDILKDALKELKMCKKLTPDIMKNMPQEIKDFFEGIGSFADVQKLGSEILAGWFEDYSEAMSYLDTLEATAAGGTYDQMTMDVINELKLEYSNKFFQSANSVLNFVIDKTSGKSIEMSADILIHYANLSYGGTVYSILDFTADLASKYSGCSDIRYNYYQLSGLITLDSHVNAEYKNVSQQIMNGNLSSEMVDSYNKLFELKRSIQISKFETMMKMNASPEMKSKYEAAINELKCMKSGV